MKQITKDINKHKVQSLEIGYQVKPFFYRLIEKDQKNNFEKLLKTPGLIIYDFILEHIQELVKTRNPSIKYTTDQLKTLAQSHISPLANEEYGVWVYYPWSNRLVHIPDEKEFIELRTSRNQNKITLAEREILSNKKVGIIGLSVGQSVAVTIAMERICTEIRLADFDILELTNLNRIRTGIHNLGLSKVSSVAREISEIDPFIKVECFAEGLNEDNMASFFMDNGKLDLLVEESDGFDIKILSRYKARELGIPVLMEASDRCAVDIERFDLEPDRKILHGLLDHLDIKKLKKLKTNEEKIPYMLDILGIQTMSSRLKASMLEIEQTINTWPQLASAVTMGGGISADVARRILLGSFNDSGRYHIDIEELISDKNPQNTEEVVFEKFNNTDIAELSIEKMQNSVAKIIEKINGKENIPKHFIQKWVCDAIQAPTAGNNQPWKWLFSKNNLFLFHDKIRSWGWTDRYDNIARIGLGAAIENLCLSASVDNFDSKIEFNPDKNEPLLIAKIEFNDSKLTISQNDLNLYNTIYLRCTNRKKGEIKPIGKDILDNIFGSIGKGHEVVFTENSAEIVELSDIVASVEKLRFMHPLGNKEFFEKELRWDETEIKNTKDGIDINTLELSNTEKAGIQVAANPKVIELLREWKGGSGFKKISSEAIKHSSAVGLLRIDNKLNNIHLAGGRALQRIWLAANHQGISIHPISSPIFFFDLLKLKNDFSMEMILELKELESRFLKIFSKNSMKSNVFLFRLALSSPPSGRSLRRSVDQCLYINKLE